MVIWISVLFLDSIDSLSCFPFDAVALAVANLKGFEFQSFQVAGMKGLSKSNWMKRAGEGWRSFMWQP